VSPSSVSRQAGGAPLSVDDSWLPWDLGPALLSADLSKGSIYERLESEMGLRVTGGHERIRAVQPDAETRATLALPDTAAVFVVERLATAGARPVEWRRSVIRGDRFSFTAAWSSDS
jgi:GntR family transcriptional regulator